MTFRQGVRFSATTVEGLKQELNTFVERLQTGGLVLYGLRLDSTTRTVAPSAAPGTGDPNLVLVNVSGTVKLYLYDVASGWVVVGLQT